MASYYAFGHSEQDMTALIMQVVATIVIYMIGEGLQRWLISREFRGRKAVFKKK